MSKENFEKCYPEYNILISKVLLEINSDVNDQSKPTRNREHRQQKKKKKN